MRVTWDAIGRHHHGLDRGIIYHGTSVIPWSGLRSVSVKPRDAAQDILYDDGVPRGVNIRRGSNTVALTAITYPPILDDICGYSSFGPGFRLTAQKMSSFSLSFRTFKANGHYQIHFLFNLVAVPDARAVSTDGDTIDVNDFSWVFGSTLSEIPDAYPFAKMTIDSEYTPEESLDAIDTMVYGSDTADPQVVTPTSIFEVVVETLPLIIVDNGDGTWTATGDEDYITMNSPSLFTLNGVVGKILDQETYSLKGHT